jgi:hypothetical protein
MNILNKITLLLSALSLYSCGVGLSEEEILAIEESSFNLELNTEADKLAKTRELLTQDNQNNFDAALKLKDEYKAQIKTLCTNDEHQKFKDDIEVIKQSDKTKQEKIDAINSLHKERQEALKLERNNKIKCFYDNKAQIGPILVDKKYLKYFCFGKKINYHKEKFYRKGKKDFALARKKHKSYDSDELRSKYADILNVSLASIECQDLLQPSE